MSGSAMVDEGPATGRTGLDDDGPETRRFLGLEGTMFSCLGGISDAAKTVCWVDVSGFGRSMRFDIVGQIVYGEVDKWLTACQNKGDVCVRCVETHAPNK